MWQAAFNITVAICLILILRRIGQIILYLNKRDKKP